MADIPGNSPHIPRWLAWSGLVMLPLTIVLSLVEGRFWLAPAAMSQRFLVAFVLGCAVAAPLTLLSIRQRWTQFTVGMLSSFLFLWLCAWRPESRWLGLWLAGCMLLTVAWRSRWPAAATTTTLLLFTVASSGYERTYGPLDAAAVQALLQTYPGEAFAFIWQEINLSVIAVVLLATSTLVGLRICARNASGRGNIRVVALVVLGLSLPFAGKDLVEKAKVVRTAQRELSEQRQSLINPPLAITRSSIQPDIDVVLLLGESTSRHQWQLYGLPLHTTPRLSEQVNEWVVLRDAVSAHSHTVPSISTIFYREVRTRDREGRATAGRISLINVLRQAGIHTSWISAQAPYGKWGAPIYALSSNAERRTFVNPNGDGAHPLQHNQASPDEQGTAETLRVLNEPVQPGASRFVVQHLFAAHWPYCAHKGSAAAFVEWRGADAWFGDATDRSEELRCYFNAMRFVDEQISRIADKARSSQRPTVVLFVPDHGEDPEGGTGHSSSLHRAEHVEIPVVAYFNPLAGQMLSGKLEAMRQHERMPFMNSWTYELVMDLFGLQSSDIRTEAPSIASQSYSPPPRVLFRTEGGLQYDARVQGDKKDWQEWTRLNMEEIRRRGDWKAPLFAHRVNTLAKALQAKRYFDGIELDVDYDSRRNDIMVYHPPAADVGLRLSQTLAAVADHPELRLWLDFKNLGASNAAASLKILEDLNRRWAIKSRSIIEVQSTEANQALRMLASAGWSMSYYIPYDFADCAKTQDIQSTQLCTTKARSVVDNAHLIQARYLSFDDSVASAVRSWVLPIKGELGLLSWDLTLSSEQPKVVDEVGQRPPMDGLIITFPSPYSH